MRVVLVVAVLCGLMYAATGLLQPTLDDTITGLLVALAGATGLLLAQARR